MNDHIALYGNVAIPRAYCPECERYAFVLDGELACCGTPYVFEARQTRRLSVCPQDRKSLPKQQQEGILRQQDHRCLYCNRRFGSTVYIKGRPRGIRVHWDHQVPFALTQDNRITNIAAACQYCNRWKSSAVFRSVEDIQVYVHQKWEMQRATSRAATESTEPSGQSCMANWQRKSYFGRTRLPKRT